MGVLSSSQRKVLCYNFQTDNCELPVSRGIMRLTLLTSFRQEVEGGGSVSGSLFSVSTKQSTSSNSFAR